MVQLKKTSVEIVSWAHRKTRYLHHPSDDTRGEVLHSNDQKFKARPQRAVHLFYFKYGKCKRSIIKLPGKMENRVLLQTFKIERV